MKRFFIALCCSLFALPAASAFDDVPRENVFFDAIEYVRNEGIVSGYGDNTFGPDREINRAEFVKIMVESHFSKSQYAPFSDHACFPDIQKGQWYTQYICFAESQNIVGGYEDGNFKPEQRISLPEMAKVLYTITGAAIPESEGEWYEPFMLHLSTNKALPVTLSDMSHIMKRGEVAEIIYRLKKKPGKQSLTFENGQLKKEENEVVEAVIPPIPEKSIKIHLNNFALEPQSIVIKKGEKIRLLITSLDRSYFIAIPYLDVEGVIQKGEEVAYDIPTDKPGHFYMYCQKDCGINHGSMDGKIIIK